MPMAFCEVKHKVSLHFPDMLCIGLLAVKNVTSCWVVSFSGMVSLCTEAGAQTKHIGLCV